MAPCLSEDTTSAADVTGAVNKLKLATEQELSTEPPKMSYLPVSSPTDAFWQSEPDELHNYHSTELLPENTDILIIGAGYAGVSTAYHLVKETKKSITVLEARGVCSGATGRNGGHLRPDLYGHIPTYCDRAGAEAGEEIAKFEIAHVQAIKKVVEEEGIDCDFTVCRSYDVWCNEEAALNAKVMFEKMKAEGFEYMNDAVFYTGKNVEGVSLSLASGDESFSDLVHRCVGSKVPKLVLRIQPAQYGRTSLSCTFSKSSLHSVPSTFRQKRRLRQSYLMSMVDGSSIHHEEGSTPSKSSTQAMDMCQAFSRNIIAT